MTPFEQAAELRRVGFSHSAHRDREWPAEAWQNLVDAGVTRWMIPIVYGGAEASAPELLAGCVELARIELTPVFILSQFQAACQRIAGSLREGPRQAWLPRLARGEAFATVGISHLTTSRQHAGQPAVLARPVAGGYRITGEIPWVTGAERADVLVGGAALEDGRQMLFTLPTDRPGITIARPLDLLALTGSGTGPVLLDDVEVSDSEFLTDIVPKVLQQGATGGAGSLTTSALAIGHAQGSIDRLARDVVTRPALGEIVRSFQEDIDRQRSRLLAAAESDVVPASSPLPTAETIRSDATSLALHASQALLTASKGAGFVTGHPAERLAREAMFFLVWSCPQAVSNRLLRDFSQCEAE